MRKSFFPSIILFCIWILHVNYFGFILKTDKNNSNNNENKIVSRIYRAED
jgi:hypothetical protein